MISRITKIKGVGRFQECNIGGRQFDKNTIIFGQNTGGKSTLTDIFWSFKTGDIALYKAEKRLALQELNKLNYLIIIINLLLFQVQNGT